LASPGLFQRALLRHLLLRPLTLLLYRSLLDSAGLFYRALLRHLLRRLLLHLAFCIAALPPRRVRAWPSCRGGSPTSPSPHCLTALPLRVHRIPTCRIACLRRCFPPCALIGLFYRALLAAKGLFCCYGALFLRLPRRPPAPQLPPVRLGLFYRALLAAAGLFHRALLLHLLHRPPAPLLSPRPRMQGDRAKPPPVRPDCARCTHINTNGGKILTKSMSIDACVYDIYTEPPLKQH
jgi:hypothetical protein